MQTLSLECADVRGHSANGVLHPQSLVRHTLLLSGCDPLPYIAQCLGAWRAKSIRKQCAAPSVTGSPYTPSFRLRALNHERQTLIPEPSDLKLLFAGECQKYPLT